MFKNLQERMKREGARVRKSALSEIIRQCKEKHNVPPHIDIKAGTVRQRLERKSSKIGPGQKSPMKVIEPYIISIITQLSNMCIPISTLQGLQLCNSIVNGTRFKNELQQFKKKHLRSAPEELGRGYWRGFLKRNEQFIKAKKAVRFDTKHEEWCTYPNMQEM
jgi:hypothetical protein